MEESEDACEELAAPVVVRLGVGGNGKDGEPLEAPVGAKPLDELQSVHVRHPEVRQDEIVRTPRPERGVELRKRLRSVARLSRGRDAGLPQVRGKHGSVDRRIVHDKHAPRKPVGRDGTLSLRGRHVVARRGRNAGDAHAESRPLAEFAFHEELPSHHLGKASADGQSEPRAAGPVGRMARVVHLHERIEDVRQHGGRDAHAGIGHGDLEISRRVRR